MLRKALVLGFGLGLVMAVVPACSPTTTVKRCDRNSCSDGCCDLNTGKCETGSEDSFCGTAGQACVACESGKTCAADRQCRFPGTVDEDGGVDAGQDGGQVQPADAGCSGCVKSNGKCETAVSVNFCGKNGAACVTCGSGEACTGGSCLPANTCPTCRDALGTCVSSGLTNPAACGSGGGSCVACAAGSQECQNGVCVTVACDANTCPNGCCSANTCITSLTDAQCGKGGTACQTCSAPNPTCDVDAGTCFGSSPGSDGGIGGLCDPTSCPNGCCADLLGTGLTVCVEPPVTNGFLEFGKWNCGHSGQLCSSCGPVLIVPLGSCVDPGNGKYACQ